MTYSKNYNKGKYSQINFTDDSKLLISIGGNDIQIRETSIFSRFSKPLAKKDYKKWYELYGVIHGTNLGDSFLSDLVKKAGDFTTSKEFIDYLIKEEGFTS